MCSSGQPGAGSGRQPPGSASDNSNNSGSQYALCALGVGLVALGIVMIVWSVVPSDTAQNSSSSGGGSKPGSGNPDAKGKTSTVAFVLVGAGVAMLLLSICLGVKSKHRQQRLETEALDAQFGQRAASAQEGETVEENSARYDVPTYEEAVGSGQYPVRQSNLRNSSSQLPSYDDLVDGLRHENEGQTEPPYPPPAPTGDPQPPPAAAAPPGRHNGLSLKLRPLKVRRIKSEKLHLKNPPQPGVLSIEPLTPPPQYEDKMPEL
ncbi:hypothetical protein MATL_G00113180 [Megalops atlanticus]|uniref:Transmembrane protein 51 n=1 Tax=Megalops atlanticus TaxID=7932 RepID=A0A9D3Q3G4_MEGAT|nr:hypothetical protein MATL_G00113180 [Megalops atlanticus]